MQVCMHQTYRITYVSEEKEVLTFYSNKITRVKLSRLGLLLISYAP